MIRTLAREWWALALRGLLTITFGLALLLWQDLTIGTVVLLFALFTLVAGGFVSIVALTRRQEKRWWVLLVEGLAGMALGLLAFLQPQLGAIGLLYLMVGWGMLAGAVQILAAFSLGRELSGQWWYGLFGAIIILLGLLLVFIIGPNLLANLWMVGVYAVLAGMLLVILAWRLRRWGNTPRRIERV